MNEEREDDYELIISSVLKVDREPGIETRKYMERQRRERRGEAEGKFSKWSKNIMMSDMTSLSQDDVNTE